MALAGAVPAVSFAQSAIDAYNLSQSDLRGTSRFMSMAGAFGALGGDLSTLTQNPAGIGVLPVKRLRVMTERMLRRRSPAAFCRPSLMTFIP